MKIALFGGSFNPPHIGHLLVASYIQATADVDRVWLMPAYSHPFGKELAPFVHRVEMCNQLASHFARGVVTTSVESEVKSGRTVDTLEYLRAKQPHDTFRLVIGTDILDEAEKWKAFDRVKELAPLLVVGRGDHPHPDASGPTMPAVSSTEVRRRLATGEDVSKLVPRTVLAYIHAHGLFGTGS